MSLFWPASGFMPVNRNQAVTKQPAVLFTAFFMLGLLFAETFGENLHYTHWIFVQLLIVAGSCLRIYKGVSSQSSLIAIVMVLGLVSGVGWMSTSQKLISHNHISFLKADEEVAVIGIVSKELEKTRTGGVMELVVSAVEVSPGKVIRSSGRLRLLLSDEVWMSSQSGTSLLPGTAVRVETVLCSPDYFWNPGAYDSVKSFAFKGIHRTGTVKYPEFIHILSSPFRYSPETLVSRIKLNMLRRLEELPGSFDTFTQTPVHDCISISKALLLGSRKEISPEKNRLFRETGLVHLLAISGLHVGIIVMLVNFLLNRLPGTLVSRTVSLICITWIYAVVTGCSPSVVRASLLVTFCFLAKLFHRQTNLLHSLALAALVILIVNPGTLWDPGFQLSFTATLGIALYYHPFLTMLRWVPGKWFRTGLAVSLAAQVITAPVSALWFNRVSILGFITGLPLIPITTIALVTGLTYLMLGACPFLGTFMGRLHTTAVSIMVQAAEWESCIPWITGEVCTPSISLVYLSLLVPVIVAVSSRRPMLTCAVAVCAYGIVLTNPTTILQEDKNSELEVWFIDVGNGDCTFIRLPNGHHILVDAGGIYDSEFDVGEKIVARTLRTLGVDRIDTAVITHPHPDHQLGFRACFRSFNIGELWVADRHQNQDEFQEILRMAERQKTRVVSLESRNINDYFSFCTNNQSTVLMIEYGHFRLLLPGDAEVEAEAGLAAYGDNLRATVLKAGHHGSRTSTTEAFLAAVKPELIFIPCGRKNQFGHPHLSVLKRIHKLLPETRVMRSDKHGLVHLSTDGYRVTVGSMTHYELD